MKLSVVIVTHNRRKVLLQTLGRLAANAGLPHGAMEVWVVDNGSTDGTTEAVERSASLLPFALHVIKRSRNEGVSARNHAFRAARGEFVLLIDDDSYPIGGAVIRSMDYMAARPGVAAVVGRVELPDGSCEASALPSVMINCAVCLRRSVLDEVGGLPTEFFRQAEEYDLSFRIWRAGYRIERFEDIVYRHEKAGGNRWPGWVHRMDLRNNLILLERYLPGDLRREYRADWTQRYTALAAHAGHRAAARRGAWEGRSWAVREWISGRQVLGGETLEAIFGFEAQQRAVRAWSKRLGLRRVVIADFSKNILATHHACLDAGLMIDAIADSNPAFQGMAYRGISLISEVHFTPGRAEGIVLSNVNPAQVGRRVEQLRRLPGWADLPLLQLWEPRTIDSADVIPAAASAPPCAA